MMKVKRAPAEETKRDRFTVYPHPKSVLAIGKTAPALNQAIECWANVVTQATKDNEERFTRHEWNFLADVLYGCPFDSHDRSPGETISRFIESTNPGVWGWLSGCKDHVKDVSERCFVMPYAESWALILAVQFYWNFKRHIRPLEDEWWTAAFRKHLASQSD